MLELIKATWPSFGVSIVSDGWTDATRHPLINFMVSTLNGPTGYMPPSSERLRTTLLVKAKR
jgi:hypothetical protein